jgi:phosphopantetheinyl transferase
MPLEKIELVANHRAWGIWRIAESEETLWSQVKEYESISDTITHPEKRLEFITGRVLAKLLLEKVGNKFEGVTKDVFGKPFFKSSMFQLSLSHSYPYVAALIDAQQSVGIDLEQIKTKLLKIAPRILHPGELLDAGDHETKHCIYWCAKEALVKIYGKKDLVFAENLEIMPFDLRTEGDITGRILVNDTETTVPLYYQVYPEYVVVFNR